MKQQNGNSDETAELLFNEKASEERVSCNPTAASFEYCELKSDDLTYWEHRADEARFLLIREGDECESSDSAVSSTNDNNFLQDDLGPVRKIGNFILLRSIGRGGGGVVFEGRQLAPVERRVAVKILFRNGPCFESRWENEPKVLAALNHPNIVSIIDSGVQPDQTPWLAMHFVDGIRADEWVTKKSSSPIEIAKLMHEVALGVAYAHSRRIVHRDLKPSNILVTDAGVPIITDFGLARLQSGATSEFNSTAGWLQGSLGYLAPEQAHSQANSNLPGADVWGLAATLYKLLTGTTPVRNDSWLVFVEDLAQPDRIPVRTLNACVPRDLESICMKGLQFYPRDRYQSALEFADDLQRFIHNQPVKARPHGRFKRILRWAQREPSVAGLLAFIVLGLLISSFVFRSLLQTASASLKKSQENLVRTLANIHDEHRLASDLLPASPGSMAYRIARLKSTIELNETLMTINPGDSKINYRLHVTQFQLAELLPNQGKLDDARVMATKALHGFEAFAKSAPQNPEYQFDIFHASFMLGNFAPSREQKRSHYLKSIDAIHKLNENFPGNPDFKIAEATALVEASGAIASVSDDFRESDHNLWRTLNLKGIEIATDCVELFPSRPRYRRQLVSGWIGVARSRYYSGRFDDAQLASIKSIDAARILLEKDPGEPTSHLLLCHALFEGALVATHRYQDDYAKALYNECIDKFATAGTLFPEYMAFKTDSRIFAVRFSRAQEGAALGKKIADIEVAPVE